MGSNDVTGRAAIIFAIAVTAAAAAGWLWRKRRRAAGEEAEPWLRVTEWGRAVEVERFPEYVARQLGFRSLNECPNLGRLASEYLRKVKGCKADMYTFFSNGSNNLNPEKLCQDLIDELDKCILGYFGFHWSHASFLISQALTMDTTTPKKKLKSIVMEATRKIRFDRVVRDLKVTRLFSTLVDEMKVMGVRSPDELNRRCTEVMVPADHSIRSPVLLLMGGGMGAGKSTVLQDILKEPFWSGTNPVVVEADAFKETDVIYRALSSRGHHNDMLPTAELVHQSSTNAASSLLVTALNEGRDVIMDGTLSWLPFVEQTITMARSVHLYRYRMGIGYKIADDGTILENYWEPVVDESGSKQQQNPSSRKPYRIELVGVVCDAYLAVIRGIRRAIMMGRAVRVRSQLQSHKNFAGAFRSYSQLVDNARLYSTNQPASPPMLIAWKDGVSNLLVDPKHINCLDQVSSLNERAESIHELYPRRDKAACSMWDEVVLSPKRKATQKELMFAIQEVERGQDQGPISTGEQDPGSDD